MYEFHYLNKNTNFIKLVTTKACIQLLSFFFPHNEQIKNLLCTSIFKPCTKHPNAAYRKTVMAFSRVSLSRVSLSGQTSLSFLIPLSLSHFTLSLQINRGRFRLSASLSSQDPSLSVDSSTIPNQRIRWKPMCLYYTRGKIQHPKQQQIAIQCVCTC